MTIINAFCNEKPEPSETKTEQFSAIRPQQPTSDAGWSSAVGKMNLIQNI